MDGYDDFDAFMTMFRKPFMTMFRHRYCIGPSLDVFLSSSVIILPKAKENQIFLRGRKEKNTQHEIDERD